MKVHLIKKLTIEDFVAVNPASRSPFQDWLGKLKYADWKNPSDMQSTFGSADLLGKSSNRVIFDIGGNNYRMICNYVFGANQVHLFVCWIGTHTDYDKLCKKEEQYTINLF